MKMKIHPLLLVVLGTSYLSAAEWREPSFLPPRQHECNDGIHLLKVTEPTAGSAERKAIMEAMRPTVSGHVGKPVIFTGNVRQSGDWATFQGNVTTADGKAAKNKDAAMDLELDFFALLEKAGKGVWRLKHWGFAGDIGVMEEARKKFPEAPRELF